MSLPRIPIGSVLVVSLAIAIVLHAAGVISGRALDVVFALSAGWMLFNLALRLMASRSRAALLAGAVVAVLLALLAAQPSLRYTPYLLVVIGNLVMAYIFARGLWPGRDPVLLQLIEAMGQRPADDPRFRRFVAGQCLLWSLLAGATAALAFGAMVFAPERAMISEALGALIGFQVVWFAASHHYARIRYHRPEAWWHTLRAMIRRDTWSEMRVL